MVCSLQQTIAGGCVYQLTKENKMVKLNYTTILIAAGLAVGTAYLLKKQATDVVDAINPTNDENIFYTGVNSIGAKLTGKPSFDLGRWIYDKTN